METLSRKICFFLFVISSSMVSEAVASDGHEARSLWSAGKMDGWVWVLSDEAVDASSLWSFTDEGNLLVSDFSKGYLRTAESFGEYRLHIEWRWAGDAGNGGVLVNIDDTAEDRVWPSCYQLQLKTGHVGELIAMEGSTVEESIGKAKTTALMLEASNEMPLGEWNVCEVVVTDGLIEFFVNGVLQNRGTAPSLKSGYIGLQLEGKAIEYRNATVASIGVE